MISNIFSADDLAYFNTHPEVIKAKSSLDASKMVYFSLPITASIRATIESRLGLHIPSSVAHLPMRWIRGDIAPHIDVAAGTTANNFESTYLVYLTDSAGELIIDSATYPIQSNTGFAFNEGIYHETRYTENATRLLLGPMNERVEPVGIPSGVYYSSTEAIALSYAYDLGTSGFAVYTVGAAISTPYTAWRIASNSNGTSSQSAVYHNGDVLNSDGGAAIYYLYPSASCFLKGSTILCADDQYIAVEDLTVGTLVKTATSGYKKVVLVGSGTIQNRGDDERVENRLYKCSVSKYPELTSNLYITGCHSILKRDLDDSQRAAMKEIYITEDKYRLMAYMDERAVAWNSAGEYDIYHFALENDNDRRNYGVYANGGLLVETCSIRGMKNMTMKTD